MRVAVARVLRPRSLLAGCGKKGAPERRLARASEVIYPRQYPSR